MRARLDNCMTALSHGSEQTAVSYRGWTGFLKTRLPNDVSKRMVYSDLLRLIIPAAIEYILLQMVSMLDQMQVGILGESALAAVGVASQVKNVFVTAFIAVNIGITALIARAVGEGKKGEPSRIFRNGMLLVLALSVAVSVLGFLFAERALILLGVPDAQTLSQAVAYLRICFLGIIPLALTSTVTAALRGLGNTRASLFYNVAANLVNVSLNWLLITGNLGCARLEVRGAAIATVAGQLVALVLALAVAFRTGSVLHSQTRVRECMPDMARIGSILRIGLPAMFEQLIRQVGLSFFTRIVTSLGTTLYAAHVICLNIQIMTFMCGMSFSIATTALTGQCLGRGRADMAVVYSRYCTKMSLLVSVALGCLYAFAGSALIRLYNADTAIIAAGVTPMRIVALMQPFSMLMYVFSGALRGAGDTRSVAIITVLTTFVLRPCLAYAAVRYGNLGLNGAWLALAADQVVCAGLVMARYFSCKWITVFSRMKTGVSSDNATTEGGSVHEKQTMDTSGD